MEPVPEKNLQHCFAPFQKLNHQLILNMNSVRNLVGQCLQVGAECICQKSYTVENTKLLFVKTFSVLKTT